MRTVMVVVILGYVGLTALQLAVFMYLAYADEKLFQYFTETITTRDERQFQLQNRVLTLEKQRNMERRVTELEKQIRTYCTGTKTEMCGLVSPTK